MQRAIFGRVRSLAHACLMLVCSVSGATAAPVTAGSLPAPAIRGVVRDSSGTSLPNVTLTIASLRRVATSGPDGAFVFRGLPAGRYHIDAVLIGFARAEATVDVPATGDDVALTIVMHATPLRLSNVVVTATPEGGDALGITQSTVDLGGKELSRSLSSSLAQTLESEPGMASRYNGPAANMPIIRGLTGERILVLQDGERSGDLSSAAPDHGTTIDPLAADRIEVVRGPASLLYGSSALGGVVNVISNEIPSSVPSHIAGYIAGQSESSTPGGAATGGLTIPLGSAVALTTSGGFRNTKSVRMGGGEDLFNSDSKNNHLGAGISAIGSRGMFGLSVGRYDFRYGLPAEVGDPEAGGKIDGLRNDGKLRAEINGNRMFPLVSIAGSATSYKHSEIENTGDVATSFNLKTQTANITAKSAFGRATGALGVNGLFKQYGATGDEALTPAADSKGLGLFLYQDVPLSMTGRDYVPHLQVGARYDSYNVDSKAGDPKFGSPRSLDFTAFSGSVGLTLPITHTASLALSAARAFRAPSVEELFSNAFHAAAGTFDVGNPDLKPETNNGVEAVYRIQSGKVDAQFATYYSSIANYVVPSIGSDTTLESGETVPLNHFTQGDATLKGVEGRIEGTVAPHLVLGAMTDVTRGSFKDGGSIPFMPAARAGGHLRWDNGKFSVGGEMKHGFKQDRVTGGTIDVPTDAYTLLGLNVGWSHLSGGLVHSVTLRADNLTDAKYRDATSRIKSFAYNPGRNFAVVYKVLF